MKMQADFRVDTHDTDMNGVIATSSVMRYMQETANLQHEVYGPTLDEVRESGKAFILSRAALDVYEPLYPQDRVTVTTWLTEAKGFGFFRNAVVTKNGEKVAAMTSFWGVIDIASRRPLKVEEVALGFTTEDEALETTAPARFRMPREIPLEKVGERTVYYSDCDQNVHMNNTNYPRVFCDFLPDMTGKRIKEFSINYLNEARLGVTFAVFRAEVDGAWFFRTELPDGRIGSEGRLVLADL
jgi:acyl-CoA thioesterase FadM